MIKFHPIIGEQYFKKEFEKGNLLNIYSDDQIKDFSSNSYKIKDELYANKAPNHLFVMYIDKSNTFFHRRLVKLIPSIKYLFQPNLHPPCFIFFNVITLQIICIGLGRKNKLFIYDGLTQDVIHEDLSLCNQSKDIADLFLNKFCALDYLNIFLNITKSLEILGQGYFYNTPKLILKGRENLRVFFPNLDTRTLNTRDF